MTIHHFPNIPRRQAPRGAVASAPEPDGRSATKPITVLHRGVRPIPTEHLHAIYRERDQVDLYKWLDRPNQRRFNVGTALCIAIAVFCIVYFGGQLLLAALS